MGEPFEPISTAAEMRAAEERYPNYPDSIPELMERAGAAVARESMLAYPATRPSPPFEPPPHTHAKLRAAGYATIDSRATAAPARSMSSGIESG